MTTDDNTKTPFSVTLTSDDTFADWALRNALQARLDVLNEAAPRRRLNLVERSERRALVEFLEQLERQL